MGFLSSLFSSSKKEEAAASEDQPKENQKNFDILKYDGVRAMQIRQVGYAIKCFQAALEIQPDFETMSYLANAYSTSDDSESALEVVDEMLAMDPEHTNTLLTRVNILFHLDRDGEAIANCDKAIELEPENFLALFLRAKAKRATNDPAGAIDDLTAALAVKEDFADGYLLRAEILLSTKEGEKAMEDVEKVISLVEEGDETAHLLRGRIYELLGNEDAAANEYQQVLELNPFKDEAYLLAGRLLTAQQKYPEALAIYDEAIDHIDSFTKAFAERGKLKELTGDKEGAEKDLNTANELSKDEDEVSSKEANFDNLYKGGIF